MKTIQLSKKFAVLISALILTSAALGSMLTQMYFPQLGKIAGRLEDPLEAWSEASYITWQYNSTYYACRNMSTNMVDYFGASDDAAIQWGIDRCTSHGGSVYVKAPTYTGTYSASVTLKDNVTLILDKGATTITVTIDSGADATLVDYENGYRKEWVAGVLYTFMDLRTGELWWRGENRTDTLAYPEQTASYIVFQDGSYTKMKNGTTGQVDASSTNASRIINWAVGNLTSGGKIFIKSSASEYLLSSTLSISVSGIEIEGEGDSTILKLSNGANVNIINITGSGVILCKIKNLRLYGNKANNSLGKGIYINTPYVSTDAQHVVEDVFIIDTADSGLQIEGDTRAVKLSRVFVYTSGNHGFELGGSDHFIESCVAGANQGHGFWCKSGNSLFINCKAFGNGQADTVYYGFLLDSAGERAQFVNCQAQDNYRHGFAIWNTSDLTLINCEADSNSKASAGSYQGFRIALTTRSIIIGCRCLDREATKTQAYGIEIADDVSDCIIVGNNVLGNLYGGIFASATALANNIVKNNRGFVTENSGTATIANNEWISHGLAGTPTTVTITPRAVTYGSPAVTFVVGVVARNSTKFQVGCYWTNGTAITTDAIVIDYYCEYKP